MTNRYNRNLTSNARRLRNDMTREERHLWYDFLKSLPVTVHRQKVLGSYIADFYIASAKIIIELDGSQHYEPAHIEKDRLRDAYFSGIGCRVLRYSNADINLRFEGVCQDIINHLNSSNPSSYM